MCVLLLGFFFFFVLFIFPFFRGGEGRGGGGGGGEVVSKNLSCVLVSCKLIYFSALGVQVCSLSMPMPMTIAIFYSSFP